MSENGQYLSSDNLDALAKQIDKPKPAVPAIHQRQYWHSADFKRLNELMSEINEGIREINLLLTVNSPEELEGIDPAELRMFAFDELRKNMNQFINEWSMQTNGFTGGSKLSPKGLVVEEKNDPVFHASRQCVGFIRRAITYRDRPNKRELLLIMRMLRNSYSWAATEAVHYTVGITAYRAEPKEFHLEKDQIRGGIGASASSEKRGRFKSIFWKSAKTPNELRSGADDLKYLDNESAGGH
ncbi:MAG: hypothetical protein ACFFD4_08220 [Candidatus Odinarchaeota archaeon]